MKKFDYRRRKEMKTNYEKRYALLKSKTPRIVVRLTNTRVILQYVLHNAVGDNIKSTLSSSKLSEIGIKTKSYKSRLCGYLAGYYFGKQIIAKKLGKDAILDLGMQKVHDKGKLFGVLKGLVDSGLNIPHEESILPTKEIILNGKDEKELAGYITKIDGLKF